MGGVDSKWPANTWRDRNMLMRSDVRFLRSTSLFWQGANDRYRGFAAPEMPQPHGPLYALRDDESIDAFGPYLPVTTPGVCRQNSRSGTAQRRCKPAYSRWSRGARRIAWCRHDGCLADSGGAALQLQKTGIADVFDFSGKWSNPQITLSALRSEAFKAAFRTIGGHDLRDLASVCGVYASRYKLGC